jgi:hypothetical protein
MGALSSLREKMKGIGSRHSGLEAKPMAELTKPLVMEPERGSSLSNLLRSKSNVAIISVIIGAIALFSLLLASSYNINVTGESVIGNDFDRIQALAVSA